MSLDSKPRFGMGVSIYDSQKTFELGIATETFGYDSVWIPDHLVDTEACKIDPWVLLGAIGSHTSRISLGTAVTDCLRVHPAKLAHMVATLDELTGGRAVLGLGAGEVMNTLPFGIQFEEPGPRIQRVVEAIKIVRLLWNSDRDNPVDYTGSYYNLRGAWLDQKHSSNCRIYIGALHSPKFLKITGQLADGWLDFVSTPSLFRKKVSKINEGAESAGRNLDEIDRTVWLGVAFTANTKELEDAIGIMKFLLTTERSSLQEIGFNVQLPEERKYVNCLPDKALLDETAKASKKVPDEIARRFMIYGDNVEEACSVIDEFVKAGATHFGFTMLASDTLEMMKGFSEKVLAPYRGLSRL
jgi:phthiodiolone/phenolphthiodiolone dimycocerosates ketoreductase